MSSFGLLFIFWLILHADLFQFLFLKKSFRNTFRESNGLNPDQDRRFVGPDLVQTVCKAYQQMVKIAATCHSVKRAMIGSKCGW